MFFYYALFIFFLRALCRFFSLPNKWYQSQFENKGVLYYTMTNVMKFEVLLFDEKGNFTMWQYIIKDFLVQQGLDATLEEEKSVEIKDSK